MSQVRVNTIVDANSGNTAQINGMTPTADSLQGFRNRIINGDMRIAQRGTAAVTASGAFPVDRFQYQNDSDATLSLQQSSTAPDGFSNSMAVTVTTADASVGATQYSIITQRIEGFNMADFGWGTANAKTVTLSFWVRSSVTGTFGGVLNNEGSARSYPYTYSISSADTWEYKTVTIAGDTSGTWLSTNGVGIQLRWSLGAGSTYAGTAGSWSGSFYLGATGQVNLIGTSGATFYITGVQLEAGSVATPFERRPYGTELALCQRYTYGQNNSAGQSYYWFGISAGVSASSANGLVQFPVTMRSKPSVTVSAANTFFLDPNVTNFTTVGLDQAGVNGGAISFSGGSGMTSGYGGRLLSDATDAAFIIWSAEL
jgi:hypothetical protein